MATSNINEQVECRRCGGVRHKAVTFCPHCGYVEEESFFDKLRDLLDSSGSNGRSGAGLLSALIGLLVAAFFLLDAIRDESFISALIALFAFAGALRAWWSTRERTEDASEAPFPTSQHPEEVEEESEPPAGQVPDSKFFCENCGTEVAEDATECPKCGMKFG
ncbi:MAG TPA: zinc-ribbon domain-containing protein [Bacteroidota bacterium]|nr:zinc-ribbon domain-containing protein [Bacteroidota bacterium]